MNAIVCDRRDSLKLEAFRSFREVHARGKIASDVSVDGTLSCHTACAG
jgi:hypothetical protein